VTAALNLATVGVELHTARMAYTKCDVLGHERLDDPALDVDSSRSSDSSVQSPPPTADKKGLALYFSSDAGLGA